MIFHMYFLEMHTNCKQLQLLKKNFQNTCITNFYLQRMYALADFYSFIFSGVPSICVSHIYRTLNKRKSPCDMIATNEHIAACSSH